MKLILVLYAILFVHGICAEEKVDPVIDEEDETPIPMKKLTFTKPSIPENYFLLYFTSPSDLAERLVVSEATKDGVEEVIAKYNGIWSVEVPQSSAIEEDYALVLKSKARHAAVSSKLSKPFDFTKDQLVVQYEVKFQNGQECGGAYIKLLSHSDGLDLKQFFDKTQYTIMFGPDRCGNENKLHFIFQHKHPKTGKFEEKHAKKPNSDIERHFTDKKTHLYTLVVNSDNTFEVYIDQGLVNSGSLLNDFEPAVNAPKEIDDPSDIKPAEWDDNAKIADPTATKPEDWDENAVEYIEDKNAQKPDGWLEDEPLTVPDETSEKPKDWDDEMDGEWEAPRIDNTKCKSAPGCGPWTAPKIRNPDYKGKWAPPMIDNPNYKGVWKARRIANPDYFEDAHPFRMTPIGAVGIELWSMTDEIAFDNFLIVDNKKAADDFAAQTWVIKKDAERMADPNAQSVVDAIREATADRPWLWLVMAAVVVLPIVLVVVYCCRSPAVSSARRPAQRDLHKKDDDIVEEADEEEDQQHQAEEDQEESPQVEEGAGDVPDEVLLSGTAEVSATSKGDLESDSEPEVGAAKATDSEHDSPEGNSSQSDGKAARKRRARKD